MKYDRSKFCTKEYRKKYTGIYGSWYAMKQRCCNSKNKQYKDYGGRGISYDIKWESFHGFKEDMSEMYKESYTLDRIDNNGNYCKENCRWATRKEQNGNKRCNIVIEYDGKRMTLLEWQKYLKINTRYETLRQRFYNGMTPQNILKTGLYRPWKNK